MKVQDLNEMFLSGDLDGALEWDETPSDVKGMDGNLSKLPIQIPKKFKVKYKKKRNKKNDTKTV